MSLRRIWLIPLGLMVLLVLLAALWLARAWLASDLAENYFQQQHIASHIVFDHLGLSGVSGRFALGPRDAPDFSAEAMEVDFDPLSLVPRIIEIRLIRPVVRADLDENGRIRFPTLQTWLDKLSSGSGHSRYVSDDLAISLSGLRALLVTPAGPLELNGDARLKHNSLLSAAITARPASLSWRGYALRLAAAKATVNAVKDGYAVDAALQGSLNGDGFHIDTADARLSAPLVRWNGNQLAAPSLVLHLGADNAAESISASHPILDLAMRDLQLTLGKDPQGQAHIRLQAGADFSPPPLAAQFPLLARDPRLAAALAANLRHLNFDLNAEVARTAAGFVLALQQPLDIQGAQGAHLRLTTLALNGPAASLSGHLDAALSGPGLPILTFGSRAFRWQNGELSGDLALKANFNFDMLRRAAIQAHGAVAFAHGAFSFALGGCAPASLAAFHPGVSDMAQNIKGALCPQGARTFIMDASGWRFSAAARDTAMTVPLGNVGLDGAAGVLAFSGKGANMGGKITVTAARLRDRAAARRFEPLTATGNVALQNWIWQGQFAVADGSRIPLGTASFHHVIASGQGGMTINAPHLQFSQSKLQPRMLSALLGSVTRAEGAAGFDGVVSWSPSGFDSHGTLLVQQLDFLTPLGTAHAFNASIVFSSLLPLITAPGQHIAISKVDWALPLSGIAMDFSFANGALKVERASTGISEGNLKLGAISLDFSKPLQVSGAADIDGVSLAPLVAASNLGSKIKLEGKVTGTLPFTYGPDGIRITNGHLQAQGPGRIVLDPSIWTQGGTLEVNAIQNLAYQAMENLAFDQLSADINSIAGGRLQVVFHIKGRNDPPHPQQAEIAVADILNGTALQKYIALPSGTPIDLTLDTTLNFDQLLKSYAEAWSKALRSSN